jgi:hypothetical protein
MGARGVTTFRSVFAAGLAGALGLAGAEGACTSFGADGEPLDDAASAIDALAPPPVDAAPDPVDTDGGPRVTCVVAFDSRFADSGTSGWTTVQRGPALRMEAGSDGLRILGDFDSDAASRADYLALRRDVILGPAGGTMRVTFGPIQGALTSVPFVAGLVGGLYMQDAGNASLQIRWVPPSTLTFLATPGARTVASFQGIDPSTPTTYEVTFSPDGKVTVTMAKRPPQVALGTGLMQGTNTYLQVGVTLISAPTADAGPFEVRIEGARAEVCAPAR